MGTVLQGKLDRRVIQQLRRLNLFRRLQVDRRRPLAQLLGPDRLKVRQALAKIPHSQLSLIFMVLEVPLKTNRIKGNKARPNNMSISLVKGSVLLSVKRPGFYPLQLKTLSRGNHTQDRGMDRVTRVAPGQGNMVVTLKECCHLHSLGS